MQPHPVIRVAVKVTGSYPCLSGRHLLRGRKWHEEGYEA
jgi:hypothetical protein